GPVPVRHRRGGSAGPGKLSQNLRALLAVARTARRGGAQQIPERQLRKGFQRGSPESARLGKGESAMNTRWRQCGLAIATLLVLGGAARAQSDADIQSALDAAYAKYQDL